MSEPEQPTEKKSRKKRSVHVHIGPNVRAFRAGRALCPVCDAEKISRMTDRDKENERAAREARRKQAA